MPNPFSAVGTRPWMRKTKAKKNANTTVEKAGELIIDDEGNLYGTNGVTQTKDLSPVVTQATADANYAPVFPTSQSIVIDPATGNVTSVTTDGVTTNYTYNPDGSVHTDACNGVIRDYGYDGSGNLTSITARS